MSNVLTGIVEPAKQENKNLTDNRPPSARSFFFTFVFLIGIGSLFLWQMARNDNPMWTVEKPLAQPVTRPTQAQAIQQAAPQIQPTTAPLATPTMIQPTTAPQIRPTLEMGIIPTREIVPTVDVAALEKQIQLQAERDRQEAEALRVKLAIERERAEIGQAAAWGWFWLALAFSGLVIALVVVVNLYARSIVTNIKKAGELAKARQNAPKSTGVAGNTPDTQNAIQTPSDYLAAMEDDNPPCKWDFFTEWVGQADGDNVPNTAVSELTFGGQSQWRAVRDWMLHSRRVFMTRESPTSGFVFTPAFWDWYGR